MMKIENLLNVQSGGELREWLMQNHQKENEYWVVVKRCKPINNETFRYIDAVEETLFK